MNTRTDHFYPNRISWVDIAHAISTYEAEGFVYTEVPWLVSSEAVEATLPSGSRAMVTGYNGALVGSAEQSFIELYLNGMLDPGRYVAASPCFRPETVDDLHQQTFFKVELIQVFPARQRWGARSDYAFDMAKTALSFFQTRQGGETASIISAETGRKAREFERGNGETLITVDSHDIELNGIEIGSYGYREYKGMSWVYGTGLAEPRFSVAASRPR